MLSAWQASSNRAFTTSTPCQSRAVRRPRAETPPFALRLDHGQTSTPAAAIFSGIAGDPPPEPRSNQSTRSTMPSRCSAAAAAARSAAIERLVGWCLERKRRQIDRFVPLASSTKVALERSSIADDGQRARRSRERGHGPASSRSRHIRSERSRPMRRRDEAGRHEGGRTATAAGVTPGIRSA